jgi:DNA-binding cell septation regulator SpoVG
MSNLNFTAKVRTISSSNSLKAFATLIINDVIAIEGYKIFDGRNGVFVTPPSHKGVDKEGAEKYFNDVNYLEDKGDDNRRGPVEEAISAAILEEYKRGIGAKRPSNTSAGGSAQASRSNPSGGRPSAPRKTDPISDEW